MPYAADPADFGVELRAAQTLASLGSGQGLEYRDGLVYAYGDADVGLIREYRLHPTIRGLTYTGRELRLTRHGEDLIPHPTGLTHHPRHGTWLGNTVAGQGTLYQIDWNQAWADGNLDRAVLHVVKDDAAVNGTRPEFIRLGRTWYLATSDYGDQGNAVRLYDPRKLARADRTSAPGVLVRTLPCGPWVQNLHWIDEQDALVLVQNQAEGLRWRLTFIRLDGQGDLRNAQTFDGFPQNDELEGFHMLEPPACVFLTSSRENNLWKAELYEAGRRSGP
jgi:hypothetical protein